MCTSDIIQIISIIVTTIISLISIIISVKTLRITNKSIQDSNRSYVFVYSDFMQISSERINYLVIKNTGHSSAIIDDIMFSNDNFYANKKRPFNNLKKCSIAPNQFYSTRILYHKTPYIPYSVTIQYHDSIGSYTETYEINTEAIAQQLVSLSNINTKSNLEKTISITAQEILRRNL